MAIKLAEAYVQIVPSMNGVGKAITDAFDRSSGTAGTKGGQSAGTGFANGLKAKMGAVIGVASAITTKAMGVISSSISSAIDRADQMNNFPKVMKNLGYSSEDAAKSVKKISDSLDGLPTTSSAMTGMVQQLAPLTSNLDEATDIALAFNNAMLAGGASTMEQENALTQLTQMLAAGTVDMQAWRSVQAAMPGQLNQVAEAMLGQGKNANDLYDALKNGEVGLDDFNEAVVRLNRDGFGKYASFAQQAKDATQGIGTAIENVKNRVAKALQKIVEAFGVENIAGAINTFSSQFGRIGDAAADMVTRAKEQIGLLWDRLRDIGAFDTVKQAWNDLTARFSGIDWNQLLPSNVWEGFRNTCASAIDDVMDHVSNLINWLSDGVQWVTAFIEAFNATGVWDVWIDLFGQMLDVMDLAWDTFGNLINRIGELFGLSGNASSFGETVGNAFTRIAETIQPVLTALGSVFDWMSQHSGTVITAIGAIGTGFAVFKGVPAVLGGINSGLDATFKAATLVKNGAQGITNAINGIGGVTGTIKNLAGATGLAKNAQLAWSQVTQAGTAIQRAFNAVLNANPLGFIITVIAAVVAALTWFFTQTETGRKIWAAFTSWLSDAWEKICEIGQRVWQGLADFFTGLWDGIKNAVEPVWNALASTFSTIWEGAKTAWDAIWNGIKTVFEVVWAGIQAYVQNVIMPVAEFIKNCFIVLAAVFVTIWNGIKTVFTNVWNAIVAFITPIVQTVSDAISTACTWISETWNTVWTAVSEFFQNIWNGLVAFFTPIITGIRDTISNTVNAISSTWNSIWNGISSFFTGIWNGMKNAVSNAIGFIGGKVAGIKDTVMGALSGAGTWLVDTGKNLIHGLINGIGDMFGWVKDKICSLGDNILGWAKGVLGIGSPSKIFHQYGEWLDEGLALGVKDAAGMVEKQMDNLTGMVAGADFTTNWTPNMDVPSVKPIDVTGGGDVYATGKYGRGGSVNVQIDAQGLSAQELFAEFDVKTRRATSGWGGE